MSARLSFSLYRLETEIERCRADHQDKRLHNIITVNSLWLAGHLGLWMWLRRLEVSSLWLVGHLELWLDRLEVSSLWLVGHLGLQLWFGRLKPRYLNEALLLLAKVHYAQGHYRDAQGMCARAGIEEFARDEKPLYHLRLLAEAFVIKGLSLDHQTVSAASRIRLSEREEDCLSCYVRACDTALLYLQELDKSCPVDVDPGYFLQAALQSAYLCLLHKGHLVQGTNQLRQVLRVVECRGSQNLRKTVARKLAEVLLSSVSEESYWGPLSPPPPTWLHKEGATHPKDVIYASSKPPQYYSTEGAFCPQDVVEEAVLLLLITESMASGEAVISRTPEHKEEREASIQDATSVYDLLSIGMARRGQYAMLSECLERAMKFSFSEFHLWYQLGLSLMASGKSEGAVSVLKECARMKPQDPTPALLAAKVCINQLHWLDEAEALAKDVIALGEGAEESLARAHLTKGLCYSLQASDVMLKADRDEFNRRALHSLKTAHTVDPQDPQIALYLSLQLALVRQVSAAMEPLQLALNLCSDDLHSLHLLVLLLSAQKHYQHALDTLALTINQYPDNFKLSGASSLAVSRWSSSCRKCLQLSRPKTGPAHFDHAGAHLASAGKISWLLSGLQLFHFIAQRNIRELFMADRRLKEAQFCVHEAGALFPTSDSVLMLKGRLAECRGNDAEAKSLYDEALAINPTGHHILIHLGKLLVRTGRVGLGEKVLRDAVQTHSLAHEAWSSLGEALQSRNSVQAPDCFLTALELESSCPIRPFTIIPREL
ncbi:Tetratricopeptide repeat protein 7A [Bagarius yarrelli]|uniref:Tetratricopeptide repeat protein 7A n=1 Tax=Bagarius yarrelli TaxID=175774 RepID=A0A556TR89_BAGYA|nr:Tetratricopeptide repeat protein 7A [Bagarius yarrelli]